jgi:hypothetical protein
MQTIEIDFDVFKEITLRRKTEDITPNDVLREVFGLGISQGSDLPKSDGGNPWVVKGVIFPQGTEFRAAHKGHIYFGKVEDGSLVINGQRFSSPSLAAVSITGNSVNGWRFWESKMPGQRNWQKIDNLRSNPR